MPRTPSLTPGSASAGYHGILRRAGAPVWTCPHYHPDTAEARACAAAERDRRTTHEKAAEREARS